MGASFVVQGMKRPDGTRSGVGEGFGVFVGVLVGMSVGVEVFVGIGDAGIRVDAGSVGGIGVEVGSTACCEEVCDSQIAMPISTIPRRLERILGPRASVGTSISFALTPPPNRPIRSATLPAIARTIGRVIFSPASLFIHPVPARAVTAGITTQL